MEKQWLHRRRWCAQLWFRLYEWLGGSGIPTRQNPNSRPRGSPLENLKTLHQQSRIHIFPRSVGSHRHTSPSQTTTHTPIYTTMRQRSSDTHAINKGSGKHQPLNNLIGSHWAWHNRQQLTQILKRVPSKANIADPFSRRDFTIATTLGWTILQAPTEHLVQTMNKIVGNPSFAHKHGFDNTPAIQQFHTHFQ